MPIYPKVLDEATSALDVNTERMLYSMLVEKGVAVVSTLATTNSTCDSRCSRMRQSHFVQICLDFPCFSKLNCDV